jgi:hypothetical protein
MATLTVGTSESVAEADFEGSATLVAVTVTVCAELIVAGAVYIPLEVIAPTAGERDHVTPALADPETTALKASDCDALRLLVAGESSTLTVGVSESVAEADFVGSATLVAVTVTVCAELIVAGAV